MENSMDTDLNEIMFINRERTVNESFLNFYKDSKFVDMYLGSNSDGKPHVDKTSISSFIDFISFRITHSVSQSCPCRFQSLL